MSPPTETGVTPSSLTLTDDAKSTSVKPPQIWWANAMFFVMVHLAAGLGMYYIPPWYIGTATIMLWFLTWQMSDFGITIGYHRMYAHKSFRAKIGVRVVLAALGSAGFQGSIKWWCLRHRLHHRFTDDPIHDPYAATRGLFYSHVGWIFYKPTYEKMDLIERDDLDRDPVPLAFFFGFICPPLLGLLWGDWLGSFVYGGLVARIFIWHSTFLVNSLAHWEGLQPYSDEDTSRGNLLLAVLTGGEGNHNFHSFPHDFRSGPSWFDWDPSKWIIVTLEHIGLVTSLRRAHKEDLDEALHHMHTKATSATAQIVEDNWSGDVCNMKQMESMADSGRCVILIDGFGVDVTSYMSEHPGGAALLRTYSIRPGTTTNLWEKGEWAFHGGLNNHSRAARRKMAGLRIAKLIK